MAADDRQSKPCLGAGSGGRADPAPEDMDFFELLRRLEVAAGARFGQGGRPDQEPARLGQALRLGFATRDVMGLRPGEAGRPARVDVALFGLCGPEGPLPLHLTRWMLDRLGRRWHGEGTEAAGDRAFLDLLNLVQHRMIALFYRSWADQRPEVQAERPGGGRIGALVRALAGPGPEALEGPRLALATTLAHRAQGPERVAALAAAAAGAPVALVEFVGDWTPLPPALQTRLGAAHARLGQGAVVGPRIFGRQRRIELRVGPVSLDAYLGLMPGGDRLARLRLAVLDALGETLNVDLRLVLARGAAPPARLGQDRWEASRLGRTAWIGGRPGREAADFTLRSFTARAAASRETAA